MTVPPRPRPCPCQKEVLAAGQDSGSGRGYRQTGLDMELSTTTSRADPSFEKDRLWLNGVEEEIKDGGPLATCIKEMKALRKQLEEKMFS